MLSMAVTSYCCMSSGIAQTSPVVTPVPPAPSVPGIARVDTSALAATSVEPTLLTAVLLLGSTSLAPSQVAPYFSAYIGQSVDAALLQQIRLAVSTAYDDAGLGLVSIDAPLMQGSVAAVRVQQLSLSKIVVAVGADVDTPAAQLKAAAALPALRVGATPRLKALDQQLRLANLQPRRRWSVDFRSAETALIPAQAPASPLAQAPSGAATFSSQPGQSIASAKDAPQAGQPIRMPGFSASRQSGAMVEARVSASDEDAFFGRVTLDNAGQPSTGRERLRLQLGHADLLGPGHALDVTAVVSVAHPQRQQQIALRYQHPLVAWSTLVTAEVSRSRSKPGLVNSFFDVSGNSRSASLSARHLLARRGALEPYLEAGLESTVNDDVVDFFGVNLGSKVGSSPLALAIGATWQSAPWSAFGQVRIKHNTGWGTAASQTEYTAARFGAKPGWTTLDASLEARLAMGGGQEAVLRSQGQWAGDPLISPQQFRVGGQNIMRGLRESEMAGDKGLALAFEYWWSLGSDHRLGGLLDTARTQRNQALANEPDTSSATTAGALWQWQINRAVRLNASAAQVISAHQLPLSRKGNSRLHMLLDWSF